MRKPPQLLLLQTPPAAAAAAAPPAAEAEKPWVTDLPIEAADAAKMMALGKLKYNTICATCHGIPGDGSGLVAKRAAELAQGYWVPPTSLHDPAVQVQPVGKISIRSPTAKARWARMAMC